MRELEDHDTEDIRATLNGDKTAYANIVGRYQKYVFAQMRNFTRNYAEQEELVQEVFVEVFKSLRKFRNDAPLLHWIRKIATRVGYHFWKKKKRQENLRMAIEQQKLDCETNPDDMSPSEAGERLHNILAKLPPEERLILTMLYLEDSSILEVAEIMGWSPNNVRVKAHRARMKLKQIFEENLTGEDKNE